MKNWPELVSAVSFLDQVDPKKLAFTNVFKEKVMQISRELKQENESESIMKCISIIESWHAEEN